MDKYHNYFHGLFGMETVFLHGCVLSDKVEIENFHGMVWYGDLFKLGRPLARGYFTRHPVMDK